jgi:hypothetical protein
MSSSDGRGGGSAFLPFAFLGFFTATGGLISSARTESTQATKRI